MQLLFCVSGGRTCCQHYISHDIIAVFPTLNFMRLKNNRKSNKNHSFEMRPFLTFRKTIDCQNFLHISEKLRGKFAVVGTLFAKAKI